MAIDIVARALAVSGKLNLENGEGTGSIKMNKGNCTAKGAFAFGSGYYTNANGGSTYAGGFYSIADVQFSISYGVSTRTQNNVLAAFGRYNNPTAGHILEVGNGSGNSRSNAFAVLDDGRAKVQTAPTESTDVVRKQELDEKLTSPATPTADSAVVLGVDGTVSTKALTSITGKTEVAIQDTAPTGTEVVWINPDGTSGSVGKLYRHNITLVNNTVRGSQTFQQDKIVYQINITLLDRNGDEINNADKLIARFDNYIYRSVVFLGVYNYNQSIGGSYNVRINNLESSSKIVTLTGSSIGNFMNHVDPIGISTGNSYGWILKTFSGSTYTADDITYTDAVTEV